MGNKDKGQLIGVLLAPKPAADYLGIKESTLMRACRNGEVPCVKVGKLVRFNIIQLNRWIEAGNKTQGGK